jgi:DNA-binding FadR family transcriptional regulator
MLNINYNLPTVMFQNIKEARISEKIVGQILEAIFRGDLKPGVKLPSEHELTKIFGVSRNTVREALHSLKQLGLIDIRQGSLGGAFVSKVDLNTLAEKMGSLLKMTLFTLQDCTEARAILEEVIIHKLIASKIQEEDLTRLENQIEKAKNYYLENKQQERILANFEFHTLLAEITQNPIIIFIHKCIIGLLQDFVESVQPSPNLVEKTLQYHRKILAYLKQGDFEKASGVCVKHIYEVSQRFADKSKEQSLLGKK